MKKLLGMAGALGIFVATTANVVACGETPKENNDDNKEEENVAIFDIDRTICTFGHGTHSWNWPRQVHTTCSMGLLRQFGLYPGHEELEFPNRLSTDW
jgi:hypothetical protein